MTINIVNAYDVYRSAETNGLPDLYAKAADLFDRLDMPCMASRCREKEMHYRLITAVHSTAEEETQ